jgi:DNA-binding MarR family transcriptional regulator
LRTTHDSAILLQKNFAMTLRLIPEIHRATHRIGIFLDGLGITQGEGHILSHLGASGEATIAELHRALAHRRSTLTSILDRLADRGWITRETDPDDRRSFIIRLSKSGKRTAGEIYRELSRIEGQALRKVSKQGLRSVVGTLQSLENAADQAARRKKS